MTSCYLQPCDGDEDGGDGNDYNVVAEVFI